MLKIEDWMTKKVITCHEDDIVLNAVHVMVNKKIGSLIVVDENEIPIGILTETDIMRKLVAELKDPTKTEVKEIMSKKVITVDVNISLLKISQVMQQNNLRRMPITKDGKLAGIITSRDLIKIMSGL